MKAEIELKATVFNQACEEAARLHCTVEEYMARAIEGQLERTVRLRRLMGDLPEGYNAESALKTLHRVSKAVNLPPVEGDRIE